MQEHPYPKESRLHSSMWNVESVNSTGISMWNVESMNSTGISRTQIQMSLRLFVLACIIVIGYGVGGVEAVVPGSILRPSEQQFWASPTNVFRFGFYARGNGSGGSYVAGIAFGGISETTLVWTAGRIDVNAGASFHFQRDGNLVLMDERGRTVWESNTGNKGAVSAAMQDDGNFVVRNDGKAIVWETFANPTDTLLVGQVLKPGKTLRQDLYTVSLEGTGGNLTLKWRNNITYWNVGQSQANASASLDSQGIFALLNSSGSQLWSALSSDYTDSSITLRRIRLDWDGNLRSYGWHQGSQAWRVGWSAVEDQCKVYGWCGNYGLCVYNETGPVCICPSANFVAVEGGGCRRVRELEGCGNNQSMVELKNTAFLSYPPESDDFYEGIFDCEQNCLKSSSCVASTVLNDGSGMCRFKTANFTCAYRSATILSTSYVKVCGTPFPLSAPPSIEAAISSRWSNASLGWIALGVVGTVIAIIAVEAGVWWFFCRNNPRFQGLSAQYTLLDYASGAPVQFSYRELQQATRGFREKVGSGGFGAVYKGTLPNRSVVAVKQLEGIEQGDKQFRIEVATISSTHHLNLVRLIGFCSEGRHRLLVYEFMKNTSLDIFLFGSAEQSRKLDWERRLNIAIGTAKGIAYLHEECRDCIIHCDIKPENILLDDNFNAKVSDFGLAKLINTREHQNRSMTSVRGTRGYLAPEWLANFPITSKSDVFSFGMVLLEIISGRRNFDTSVTFGRMKFSTWAFEEFERGNFLNIVDEKLGKDIDLDQVERAIRVSFWCIQEQPSQRPPMGKVVQMLEGVLPIDKPHTLKSLEGLQNSSSMNASVSATGSMTSVVAVSAPPASSSSSADAFLSSASRQNMEVTLSRTLLSSSNNFPSETSQPPQTGQVV